MSIENGIFSVMFTPFTEFARIGMPFITVLSIFMHQYRHNKLPTSFSNIFADIICTDHLQTRHNDFNYVNRPALNKNLETFPYKKIISSWNSVIVDLKSTAEFDEFYELLKKSYLSNYMRRRMC